MNLFIVLCFNLRYLWSHIQSILERYDGSLPLAAWLKHYFRQHSKLGSRDRKILSEMVYCYYRCAKGLPANRPLEETIPAALFLCGTALPQAIRFIPSEWQQTIQSSLKERTEFLARLGIPFRLTNTSASPFTLSEGIDSADWFSSMLTQPDLFIRIRKQPGQIKSILQENNIQFREVSPTCIALPNGIAVDKLLPPDAYVIQDASSQQTASYMNPEPGEQWWDCCCGAGGKSLLLKDLQHGVRLTATDKRASILHNLRQRFARYGHQPDATLVLDATNAEYLQQHFNGRQFDNIIADVPCTGSGTWARTPEQLYFFLTTQIDIYAARQKQIAANTVPYLRSGGRLLYITCSVFREENEDVVDFLTNSFGLRVEAQNLINGISQNADSMFIAVLHK